MKIRPFSKIMALSLCIIVTSSSILMTGCQSKPNHLMNYKISPPILGESDGSCTLYSGDFLSKGVAVIPQTKLSPGTSVLNAKEDLIVNDTTGKVVYAKNIYDRAYPASVTKIVTAYVALKYGNLNDTVTIGHNATHIKEYGAKLCGFQEGDRIQLKELLYSFLVFSGNDAGIAIAEHIGGSVSKFAAMMNQEMANLGCVNSHFVNPHGLQSKHHYTSAYDLYLVFHQLVQNKEFLKIVSTSYYQANFVNKKGEKKRLSFTSTDKYLTGYAKAPKGIHVIGGKTGTTIDAGSCLILYSKSKNKNHYISVVLKAPNHASLYQQMTRLLTLGSKEE